MTQHVLLGYGVEFLIQTAFLSLAFWIMILIQKLNYTVFGLLASAALSTVVGMVLDRFMGIYFSTPFVCAVMFLCVWKLTQADTVDVAYTVAVGRALVFGMNLFLLGWLMGDLHVKPARGEDDDDSLIHQLDNVRAELAATNAPAHARASNAPAANILAAAPAATTTPDNPPRAAAPKPVASAKAPAARMVTNVTSRFATNVTARTFSLKGVTTNGTNSVAIISTGTKTYTIYLRQTISMQVPGGGSAEVRFDDLEGNVVRLLVNGERVLLYPP